MNRPESIRTRRALLLTAVAALSGGCAAAPTTPAPAAPSRQAEVAQRGASVMPFDTTTDGARATYTTTDPVLRDALHHWLDAQVSDHGQHATG